MIEPIQKRIEKLKIFLGRDFKYPLSQLNLLINSTGNLICQVSTAIFLFQFKQGQIESSNISQGRRMAFFINRFSPACQPTLGSIETLIFLIMGKGFWLANYFESG